MEDSKGIRVKIKENSELKWNISEGNCIEQELYTVLNWERQCFIYYAWEYIDIIKFFGDIKPEDKSKIKGILSDNIESANKLEVKIQGIKFHMIQEIENEKGKQADYYLEKMFSKDGKLIDWVNFSIAKNEVYFRNNNGIGKDSIAKIYNLVKKLWGHKAVDITHVNNMEIVEVTVIQDLLKKDTIPKSDFYL